VGPNGGNKTFADIHQQAEFNIAYNLIKTDRAAAAKAFLAFMERYPKSDHYKEALWNAANSLDIIGKTAEANKLFERYIAEYPSDELAMKSYFRIADGYSQTLELNKAIQYYEQLATLFPTYQDSPAALFNAAFLRVGVGDHTGAARAFEKYATVYKDQPDAESAFWRAGEQWGLVGENESLDFYQRYVKRYPTSDANHLVEAYYRIAKIYEGRKDSRHAAQAWQQVQASFAASNGATLTARTRSLAAEGALNQLLTRYEAFKVVKWTTVEAKNVDILLKSKPEELQAITEASVQLIQTYQDYDTAAAALYIQGMTYFAYADMAYSIPPPKGLSDEEKDIYIGTIDEKFRIPSEDRGKARLVAALEKAKGEKRWSDWNTKALIALNERYPTEYAQERKESRGSASATAMPLAGPEAIPLPAAPADPDPSAPTGGAP
jgi:TolA-binding protein